MQAHSRALSRAQRSRLGALTRCGLGAPPRVRGQPSERGSIDRGIGALSGCARSI
jgi:hypothetical protein